VASTTRGILWDEATDARAAWLATLPIRSTGTIALTSAPRPKKPTENHLRNTVGGSGLSQTWTGVTIMFFLVSLAHLLETRRSAFARGVTA